MESMGKHSIVRIKQNVQVIQGLHYPSYTVFTIDNLLNDIYHIVGELRRSLPAIIVEILEERLETDQINTVVSLANELFDENGKLVQSQGGTSSDDFNNDEAGDGNSQVSQRCH